MVDFISIVAEIEPLFSENSFEPFEWRNLIFTPVFAKTKTITIERYKSEYDGLRVLVFPDKVQISNSLHKFYKANNYSDFSFSELKNAIDKLCEFMGIEAALWEIKKLEFGFNILAPQPAKNYINLPVLYKEREFAQMNHKGKCYGRKCYLSEYAIKIYDKSLQTKSKDSIAISDRMLRVEMCYLQKRKIPKGIRTLADLKNGDNIKLLYNELIKVMGIVIYNDEVNLEGSNSEERTLFFASFNPSFLKAEQQHNKGQVRAIKSNIKQLRERFFERGFKKWLLNTISDKYIELFCS